MLYVKENPSNIDIMGVKEEDKTNHDQCNLIDDDEVNPESEEKASDMITI